VSSRPFANGHILTPPGTKEFDAFRRRVLASRQRVARDLPWTGSSPWAIYLSEVMLQQTSVARAREQWRILLHRYPTPGDLAASPLADVLRAWAGLGYPRRAVALHRAAQRMVAVHGGGVPSTVEELLDLPGVGPYTANAVASFAFGAPVGVLDTNVGRVLARAVVNAPLRTADAWALAHQLVSRRSSASWNQALLDIGAQYCRPQPTCAECVLVSVCRWQREGGDDPAVSSAGVSRPQALFAGSRRQARGRMMRAVEEAPRSLAALAEAAEVTLDSARDIVESLRRDGLVVQRRQTYYLPGDEPRKSVIRALT